MPRTRIKVARRLENLPLMFFILQSVVVMLGLGGATLPFFSASEPVVDYGPARVVECHRWPIGLWLTYECKVDRGGSLGIGDRYYGGSSFSDEAISTHRLHGYPNLELHATARKNRPDFYLLTADDMPKISEWLIMLFLPAFLLITWGIISGENRILARIAHRIRQSVR